MDLIQESNGEVKIRTTRARVFVLSPAHFSDGPEMLLNVLKVWDYCLQRSQHLHGAPTPPRAFISCLFQNYGCSLYLKLNHSITWYCWKSKNLKSALLSAGFTFTVSPSSFDPPNSSNSCQSLLCSSCLFKSHISLEISFQVSGLSLYSLLISPSAAIYLTLW